MHNQQVLIRVRYNQKTRTLEIGAVEAGPLGTVPENVDPEPPGSLDPQQRYWPVLRMGGKQLVLCEIDDAE